MQTMMKTKEIRIPFFYKRTPPKQEKIENHMRYYLENGTFNNGIVVTQRGLLIDGYCNYIVAVQCGIPSVQCKINTKHINSCFGGRERTIRNPKRKRKILYDRQSGKCAICGKQLQIDDHTRHEDYLSLDHILPVSRGGSNGLENLQGLCIQCNHQKDSDYKED